MLKLFKSLYFLAVLLFIAYSGCMIDPVGYQGSSVQQTTAGTNAKGMQIHYFEGSPDMSMNGMVFDHTNVIFNTNTQSKGFYDSYGSFDSKINTVFYHLDWKMPIYSKIKIGNTFCGPVEILGQEVSSPFARDFDMIAGDNPNELLLKNITTSSMYAVGIIEHPFDKYVLYSKYFSISPLSGAAALFFEREQDIAYGNDESYAIGNIFILTTSKKVFYLDLWSWAQKYTPSDITKNLKTDDLDDNSRIDATKSIAFVSGINHIYGTMNFNGVYWVNDIRNYAMAAGVVNFVLTLDLSWLSLLLLGISTDNKQTIYEIGTPWYHMRYLEGAGININKKSIKAKRRYDSYSKWTYNDLINRECTGPYPFPFTEVAHTPRPNELDGYFRALHIDIMFEGTYFDKTGIYYAYLTWNSRYLNYDVDWWFAPTNSVYPVSFDTFRSYQGAMLLKHISAIGLISPDNSEVFYPEKFHFLWKPATTALSYELELVNNKNGKRQVFSSISPGDGQNTVSYDVEINDVGNYSWKVHYIDCDGTREEMQVSNNFIVRHTGVLHLNPSSVKWWIRNSNLNDTLSWKASSANSIIYYTDNNGPIQTISLNSGTKVYTRPGETNYGSMVFTGQIGHRYDFKLYSDPDTNKGMLLDSKILVYPPRLDDDIIVINSAGLKVYNYFANGQYGLINWPATVANVSSFITGDLNNDGFDDIFYSTLVPNSPVTANQIALSDGFHNQYSNTSYAQIISGSSPTETWLTAVDVNGDGYDEMLSKEMMSSWSPAGVTSFYSNIKTYKYLNGEFIFQSVLSNVCTTNIYDSGDFNRDGKSDIVSCTLGGTIQVYLSANNAFQPASTWYVNSGTISTVAIGDYNGDARDDLAIVCSISPYLPSVVKLLLSTGNSFSFNNIQINSIPNAKLISGDFNKDGKSELGFVVSQNNTTVLTAFKLNGNTLESMGNIINLYGLAVIGTGKVDGISILN